MTVPTMASTFHVFRVDISGKEQHGWHMDGSAGE